MASQRKDIRVRVDWDNDGYLNQPISTSTPINLIPSAAYVEGFRGRSRVLGAGVAVETDIKDVDDIGFTTLVTDFATYASAEYGASNPEIPSTPLTLDVVPLTLPSGVAHNLSLHAKADAGVTIGVEVYNRNMLTGVLTSLVSTTFVVGTTYQRYAMVVPSQLAEFAPFVEITVAVGTPIVSTKGLQVTTGATIYEFTVGTLGAYDDITSYVLTADWQLGRGSFDEVVAYEGTLDLDLNNDSRIFSPDNVDSPLHGNLEQNRKVLVEVKHQGVWQPMWAGWTSAIKVVAGKNRSLQASLACLQGLYRLREGEFSIAVENGKQLHEVVLDLITRSGWRSAKSPFSFVLNVQALLGVNTYISNIDDLFTTYDVGRNTIETVGYNWGRETGIETALKDVLMSEYAKLMVGRDGGLILHNRLRYINAELSSLGSITLDTKVHDAKYTYGENLLNRIEIVTKAKKEVKGAEIWTTPSPVYIRGFDYSTPHHKVTKLIPMHFTFEEGKQRTITGLDAKMADMEITVRHGRTGKVIDSSVWNGQVWAAILGDGGNKYTLQLRNNLANSVTIEVTITGDYLEGGQGQIYIVEDVESQERLGAVHYEVRDVPILSNLEQAQGLAELDLRRRSQAVGEVNSITFIAHDDDLLSDIISYGLGDTLAISEIQTGMSGRYHTIIGESGSYAAGDELKMTYDLARTDENPYPVIGTGKMQGYDNLMPSRYILEADLFQTDHMRHKVVSVILGDYTTALKVWSYAYGSTLWFGSVRPLIARTFSSEPYKHSWFQNSGSTPQVAGDPNVMYSKFWGTEDATGVLTRGIAHEDNLTVAKDTLGIFRTSMVWKGTDATTIRYRWIDADDTIVPPIVRSRTYNLDKATNLLINGIGSSEGHMVASEYHTGRWRDRITITGSTVGVVSADFHQGDMYHFNLEDLDHSHLSASTEYRFDVWARGDLGKTANIAMLVVEHDVLVAGNEPTEHIVPLVISTYGKYSGTFTTSSICSRVSIGIRAIGVEYPPVAAYITGIALVDNSVAGATDVEEYNTILPTALRAYI